MDNFNRKRVCVNTSTADFQAYDLEGVRQPDLSLLPLSLNRKTGFGAYMMRMQPGAITIEHEHPNREEFLMLEGHLIDSDGTEFGPGDYVMFEPGTRHNSRTEAGCLIIVFEWKDNLTGEDYE